MAYRIGAKESVGYYATWTLGGAAFAGVVDLTGWEFKATFERYAADAEAFTLEMAADDASEGFRIHDGPARQITCRILPATLAGVDDTTGKFSMFTDLLATPPGEDRFFVAAIEIVIERSPTA